ncbi:MAG: hypothetical protein KDD29_05055 [Flavobacteriales bacterium]|nr:hypothetical protein [Flavobacteriales bacterium]MCB9335812.1 hypothetical protein [Flavobacteriales bacterium]
MKKVFILPVVLIASMVVSCGPSQEEIEAKEQAIADSTAAYQAQIEAEAKLEAESQAADTTAIVDSTSTTQPETEKK